MSIRGWGRTDPGSTPDPRLPDLHPAQLDLLIAEERIKATLTQVDDSLRRAGNARPTMRDRLLDIRIELTRQATP
jgi:hypothetical protein